MKSLLGADATSRNSLPHNLRPRAPPRPPLLQTRSFDMDRGVDARRLAAAREEEAEAKAAKAAQERIRYAARLAAGGGTSASGGGGGGVSTKDMLLNACK